MNKDQIITLIIFGICYVYLCIGKKFKPVIVWASSILLILLGMNSIGPAFNSINWNVLGTFSGTLIVAQLFISSKAPLLFAKLLVDRSRSVGVAIVMVCLLAGFVSAWVDNVATVLIVAPIAFTMAEHMKTNPVPFLIGIAVSSNLQGSATLIGDAPSMILASYANPQMGFNDFFWMYGKPGLFFAVQIGAVLSALVLYQGFAKYKEKPERLSTVQVVSWIPGLLLAAIIVVLALWNIMGKYISPQFADFQYKAGVTCMTVAAIGLLWYYSRKAKSEGASAVIPHFINKLRNFEWNTILLLAGLFVLVGTLTQVGLIHFLADLIKSITGGSVFLTFLILVWASVLLSAFIDNIPYVTALAPVVQILGDSIGKGPQVTSMLLFGLLLGATIGGNITPIGASANVVAVGMLEKKGYNVSFNQFVRIGLPFTLVATISASAFIWLIWIGAKLVP